jgi:DnaD/phage-associated family protein
MTRRMITSDIFEDEFFINLDMTGRVLWFGLVARCADDQGRLQDNSILIKSQVFPADEMTRNAVEKLLDQFQESKRILRYQIGDKRMIQILNWWKYQTPSWAGRSKYPAPEGWLDREKYHGANGQGVINLNWDKNGGYQDVSNHDTNHLTNQDTNLVSKQIDDVNVKGEGEVNGDDEVEEKPATAAAAAIYSFFQKNITLLTPHLSEILDDAVKEYTDTWVMDALKETSAQGVRNFKYTLAILDRWKRQGRKGGKPAPGSEEDRLRYVGGEFADCIQH